MYKHSTSREIQVNSIVLFEEDSHCSWNVEEHTSRGEGVLFSAYC